MFKKVFIGLFLAIFAGSISGGTNFLSAQNAFDALRYTMQYPGGGALSMSMPGSGVTTAQGFGSTLDNPASGALFENSGTFAGLSFRNVSETGTYLGNSQDANENNTSLSNLGFVYTMPTQQGSFVFGAGYVKTTDYDRALGVSGYNSQSTITDMYNQSGFYIDAAYNAFALDSLGNGTAPVLRINGFQGIHQRVQLIESGKLGEITGFLATEFQKNLFMGVSLSIPMASYSYERTFIETDTRDVYTQFPYDVNDILSKDEIDATISGVRARVGMIYKLPDNFSIGINYQFRSTLNVEEDYRTLIESTFDTGDPLSYDFEGAISYEVETPARLSAGVALKDINGFTMTISGEWVDYGNMEMQGIGEVIDIQENDFIEEAFESVINMKAGLNYKVTPLVRPYVGYAYYPDPNREAQSDRTFISGGVNLGRKQDLNLNLGLQYAMWEDEVVLYDYENQAGSLISAAAQEDVGRLQVMVGLSYNF